MRPETDPHRPILGDIPALLDEETLFMSGGFDRLDGFQTIVDFGRFALPELLEGMVGPKWWRMQAIWTIAHNMGNPIDFSDEVRGRYSMIRETIVSWAQTHGYTEGAPINE